MKNKIFLIFIIFLTLFLTISTISANDNTTDVMLMDDDSSDIISVDEDLHPSTLKQDSAPSGDSNKSQSNISASDKVSYVDYEDTFTVDLTSNGTGLADKPVKIDLNGVTYNIKTDNQGKASINFKLGIGTYHVYFFFEGDENYTSSNGTATITVQPELVTYLNVADKDINYREGLKSLFQLRLTDIYSNTVKGQTVYVKVDGKTYSAKTNSKGYATFHLSLKKGTHTIEYSYPGSGEYVSSHGSFTVYVKTKLTKGNGYWVNRWDMKKVNLKKLSKKGTKHIFLLHTAFEMYGEKNVLKWIKKAHKYGIKVHIWISVFYKDGKFIHPVSKKGAYNYNHMNKIIKQVKHYASLEGVDGIHFDYIRFPGNAYKYKNAVNAVNYFAKTASVAVHNIKPDIIVSAAVMPEPTSMKHYYAQDVPTMSKYMDAIVPMIYKGNYHASSKWIKKTTKKFVKQSNGAKIWAGLQTYKSDSNIKKLSYSSLFKDAKNAKKGGASGVVLFRWGLSALLNFKKL